MNDSLSNWTTEEEHDLYENLASMLGADPSQPAAVFRSAIDKISDLARAIDHDDPAGLD